MENCPEAFNKMLIFYMFLNLIRTNQIILKYKCCHSLGEIQLFPFLTVTVLFIHNIGIIKKKQYPVKGSRRLFYFRQLIEIWTYHVQVCR